MDDNIAKLGSQMYDKLKSTLGAHFANVRNARGISLRDLSAQTGISKALISAFEFGDRLPRMDNLINLILALEIPFGDIFGKAVENARIHYNCKDIPQRDNEVLANALLKMGLDKNDITDVESYVDFIKFRKHLKNSKNSTYKLD